jgi:hypothetical protein
MATLVVGRKPLQLPINSCNTCFFIHSELNMYKINFSHFHVFYKWMLHPLSYKKTRIFPWVLFYTKQFSLINESIPFSLYIINMIWIFLYFYIRPCFHIFFNFKDYFWTKYLVGKKKNWHFIPNFKMIPDINTHIFMIID